ncbi:MAG: restriction endonuclease [Deltaproteobacteria bacterium]|jgi:hypothetical protein|nr:restriction endonuclease [Deltaproteobacteria bacterium]
MRQKLTIDSLITAAKEFCYSEKKKNFPTLIGVTDGKAIGAFVEHRLKEFLFNRYEALIGDSASGIDLPSFDINTDIKVTSIKQPQSSCPFKSARQKIYGLGYNILLIVYNKIDTAKECHLNYLNCTFIYAQHTADFTMTKRLSEMLKDGANVGDIMGFFYDKSIPGDEISLTQLAEEVLENGVEQGYLTISNALRWRLQYQRVISLDNSVSGVLNCEIS